MIQMGSILVLDIMADILSTKSANIYINKAGCVISGTSLRFTMDPQWQIYSLQNVQLGLTWHILKASTKLATCNVAPSFLARA